MGYLAFIRGGFAGGDIFANQELYARQIHRLLRSYHLDSLDQAARFPGVKAESILKAIQEMRPENVPSIGKGTDLRFDSEKLTGGVTLLDGSLAHLTVFPNVHSG
jgi:hypothetical protein